MLVRSPPLSSFAIVESETRLEPKVKKPLQLDKVGLLIGKIANLFHNNIMAFVKGMNSTIG